VASGREINTPSATMLESPAHCCPALRSPELTDTSIIAGPWDPDQGATALLIRTFGVWAFE
jgi:hypothetical protein